MLLSVDIGGTHIRLKSGNIYIKSSHNAKSFANLTIHIDNFVKNIDNKIDLIVIALPCIIDNYIAYNQTNLKFLDKFKLPVAIHNIKVIYMNDGDLSLLGEIKYHNIDYHNHNILSLIFGTGVGCGLWINKQIKNSEVYQIFEDYLGGKTFNKDNIINIRSQFISNLGFLIELLNLKFIILNGFIKNYDTLKISIDDLNIPDYYKKNLNIVYSECENPVILGCETLQDN